MRTVEAQREYQRQWVAKRRADWFSDKFCVDCASVENLELDHVDSSQKISHSIWSWSKSRRETEIAKCVVRCRPCHKLKTLSNKDHFHVMRGVKLTESVVSEIRSRLASGES